MLRLTEGNLLEADAEALVNTVNTVGVMGRGIALQFKKAFPEMVKSYEEACRSHAIQPGRVHVFDRGSVLNPRYIINFPTKRHWKGKSRPEDIEKGLKSLVEEVRKRGIHSIALPPLGCGLGGLAWSQVLPMIRRAFADIPNAEVSVFPPSGAPDPKEMVDRTECPQMNPLRANVIRVLGEYCVLGYELTLLEIHKLLYFMQFGGEPLRLRFSKDRYGPYADNLRHVMNLFEGHFVQGYGEGRNRPTTPIKLLPQAVEQANEVSRRNPDSGREERLQRVFRLIEGFESPYGMELLASVHWVAREIGQLDDSDALVAAIHGWNDRKRKIMKREHIEVAWQRLKTEGWLEAIN
jgi:O-acetyl-ADP-ribose deacetylase (regulator of RNase III)